MKKRICSICGADKNSEYCSHTAGKEYGGKKCFVILDEARDAYEFSFVAVPAQPEAGVEKSFFGNERECDMNKLLQNIEKGKGFSVSDSEAVEISKYFSSLKEDAEVGKKYKNSLVKELVKLCSKAIPAMDLEIFEGVARVMTAKELIAFKKAFSNSEKNNIIPAPQLKTAEKSKLKADFSQFKI
ncbi:MAG: hypothetical protein LUG21_04105 [Clostridiales bacterium]|nr:hypothetical protein [Clostridiales bacterium]